MVISPTIVARGDINRTITNCKIVKAIFKMKQTILFELYIYIKAEDTSHFQAAS